MYTSGTMGKPKGVRLSNRAIVETAQQTGELLEMEPADRVLAMVPFFTMFGLSVLVGTLAAGATLVLQDEFEAGGAVALLKRERVTVMHGVPTMYQLIMRLPDFDPSAFPSLRTGVIAGGPVNEELLRRIRRWCNVQLAYGLTETGPTMTMTRFSDPADKRLTTVGRALPGVEIKVVDIVTAGRM
jgi:fatty-acyl-CoA synthase